MEYIKLSDICIDMHQGINTVADKVEYKNSGFPIIQSKNITSGYLDLEDVRYLNEENYLKYKEKYNPKVGDILLCNIGTIGSSFVISNEKSFLIAWNLFKLKINIDKYNSKYIKYYLDRLKSINYFDRLLTGGTVKFINKTKMGEIKVPICELCEQDKIVSILDKAQELIDKRKEQIEALDELVKSKFIEMFGDSINNSKYKKVKLEDLGEWRAGGTPSRSNSNYYTGSISWLSSGELNQKYCYSSNEHITEEAINNSSAKLIEIGSLLLGMYDTAALKSTITKIDCACNQAIAYSKLNINIVNTEFIYYCIQFGKEHYKAQQRGVRQKNLNLTMIKELKVILPPIELQNQFDNFAKQIDKLKFEMENSLKELEENFNSLMQRAFKGELF